ncbi:MAG: MerR family transcriptional regulator, partial [Eisenbergiella sp.]
MNNSYKIKEISRLYGLCSDTLRYYEEQGLLSPKRGENRYRMFGVQDIGKLNVIRSLRELDIPLERIREYIHNRDIDSTLRLLDEEETLILSQIERLREKYEDINTRKTELQKDRQIKDRQFSIRRFEARPCFQLTEDIILENDVDFVLKKLEQKYEDNIHAIGIKGFGAEMDPVSMEQG